MSVNLQDMTEAYFEYKIDMNKTSREFQTLGWVDEQWWFERMGGSKVAREICFSAAVQLCKRSYFEIYAAVRCEHCDQVSRWEENPNNLRHLDGVGLPCTECGHMITKNSEELSWNFKLAKHLIQDEETYFSGVDDLEELRQKSLLSRFLDFAFPWRKK